MIERESVVVVVVVVIVAVADMCVYVCMFVGGQQQP